MAAASAADLHDLEVAALPGLPDNLGLHEVVLAGNLVQVLHDLNRDGDSNCALFSSVSAPRNNRGRWSS